MSFIIQGYSSTFVFRISSLTRKIMAGETDNSSNPILRKVEVRVVSAPSSPQIPTQQPCLMTVIYDHLKHSEDCFMMGIIEAVKLWILTVNRQCVLGQVIGSNGEEINLLCQKIRDHDCCAGVSIIIPSSTVP